MTLFVPVRILVCGLAVAGWSGLSAQTGSPGRITGTVTARENGKPVPFASVMLEGTKIGAASDESGNFAIVQIPPGTYTLIVRALGFKDWNMEGVDVHPGSERRILAALEEAAIPLDEIQVTAERARRQADIRVSTLNVAPVRTKTLAGVAEDVLRTLQSLPGVLSPSDFSSQLVIRGGGPDQNLIIMDDIEVFNPYRLYGLISMFNPETAAEISLLTGGFPARYGDRLSAVLDVTNREGDRSRPIGGSLNASITNANLVLNGRAPFDFPGSYLFSARRTYYDLILGPIARKTGLVKGDVAFPNFMDFQSKLVFEPSQRHRIVATMLFSKDGVELISGSGRKSPDSVNVSDHTRNDVAGLAWRYYPSKTFYLTSGVSWYLNDGTTAFGGDFVDPALNRDRFENGGDTTGIRLFNVQLDSRYQFRKVSLKSEGALILPGHLFEGGGGMDFLRTSLIWHFRPDDVLRSYMQSRGIAFAEDFIQSRDYVRVNAFVQDKAVVADGLAVQPGLRFDYYGIIRKSYVSPRLNVSYAVNPLTTLRAAWGIYRQSPGYEKALDQNAFYDLTTAPLGGLEAERACHYVLGMERWIDNEWIVRVEGYYKSFDRVIVQEIRRGTVYVTTPIPGKDQRTREGWTDPVASTGDSLTTIPINGATGSAYGIELLVEKRNLRSDSRLSGWIGCALARAERLRDGVRTPFRFDQRYTVDVVLDYRIAEWISMGIRWKYGSNFPYTAPVGLKPRIVTGASGIVGQKLIQVDRGGNVIFDIDRGGEANKFSGRLPAYHRLDVRFTARTDFWGLDWDFYLDVINIYNRANVLSYQFYASDDLSVGRTDVTMFPILPTLGFSARF
jgi:hypothetical protein